MVAGQHVDWEPPHRVIRPRFNFALSYFVVLKTDKAHPCCQPRTADFDRGRWLRPHWEACFKVRSRLLRLRGQEYSISNCMLSNLFAVLAGLAPAACALLACWVAGGGGAVQRGALLDGHQIGNEVLLARIRSRQCSRCPV